MTFQFFPKSIGVHEDDRIVYSKSSIIEQIEKLIQIVMHPVEEDSLLKTGNVPVIPYYAIGLFGKEKDVMRQYLAERLFDGAFVQWSQVDAVLSSNVGRYIPLPKELVPWMQNSDARLNACEIDFLCEFTNVVSFRHLAHGMAFIYGAKFYRSGVLWNNRLTSEWLRNLLGFHWKHHTIDFDK